MDRQSRSSFHEERYEAMLSVLVGRLRAKNLVPTESSLSQLWGSDNLSDDCFESNHEYLAGDIDFEACLRRHIDQPRKLFVGWHYVELFGTAPECHGEVFGRSRFGGLNMRPVVYYTVCPYQSSPTSME